MKILAFQITPLEDIPFQTQASTLDEMTRELPEGFYTTFSTLDHGTKVFGLHAHLQRLYIPAADLGINIEIREPALRNKIAELAKLNFPSESRIRVILTKNEGLLYIGIQLFEKLSQEIYENGVKVVTTQLVRRSPLIKDTNFISTSLAEREKISQDVFEVLLTRDGKILEGMTSNFYAIRGKTLITAKHGILHGVTRQLILRLARGQGMIMEYHAPDINEKMNESFLTSSSRGVVPIIAIDERVVGQGRVGRVTKQLSASYEAYVKDKSESIIL
jgi:branched-chain amino acid aminotransferase